MFTVIGKDLTEVLCRPPCTSTRSGGGVFRARRLVAPDVRAEADREPVPSIDGDDGHRQIHQLLLTEMLAHALVQLIGRSANANRRFLLALVAGPASAGTPSTDGIVSNPEAHASSLQNQPARQRVVVGVGFSEPSVKAVHWVANHARASSTCSRPYLSLRHRARTRARPSPDSCGDPNKPSATTAAPATSLPRPPMHADLSSRTHLPIRPVKTKLSGATS